MSAPTNAIESPVLFGTDRSLVGSLCLSREDSGGDRPTVLFLNAGIVHRVGPNRIYVRLARALAAEGYSSLRFDLSGVGDSVLPPGTAVMSVEDRVKLDIEDALEFLRARGSRQVVLIGLCSGADNALRTMARTESVVGSVLLDLNAHRTRGFYLRHYARSLFSLKSWLTRLSDSHSIFGALRPGSSGGSRDPKGNGSGISDATNLSVNSALPLGAMRDHFLRIVNRRGRLLCIFTAGLPDQYNYREQLLDSFPKLDFNECLRLEYFGDSDHTFSFEIVRDRLTRTVVEWVRESFPG